MIITSGKVRGGKIELDDEALPEGTKVTVLARSIGVGVQFSARYWRWFGNDGATE